MALLDHICRTRPTRVISRLEGRTTHCHGVCAALTPLKAPQAVTRAKLGFDPIEVDPEDMLRFAAEDPQVRRNPE